MKNFSNILATSIVALFLLSFGIKSEAVGQIPNGCESDPCYQTQPWINHVKSYTYGQQPDCSSCWVEIHYRTRNNSTNPNCSSLPPIEYQLDFIIVSGTCYYAPCSQYVQFDMKAAYQEAMTSLLNDLNYAPVLPDSCGPVFQDLTITNCFREDFDSEGNRILRLCDTFTCCKQNIQLCYKNGKLKISSIKTANTGDCGEDPNHPDECKTICNWIDDAIVPKRALEDNNKSEINPLNIFPNPVSDKLLTFNLTINSNIEEISILTNDGKLLQIKKADIINNNQINTENLSNGIYMLIIKVEYGKNYYSQFVIKR